MKILPSRIGRYVFAEMIPPSLLALSLWTFVLLMNHFFVVAEKALSKNLGWDLTLRLFVVGIPELLVLTIPMSVLLGVMIAMGRLSADYEWVSMQAAGLGPLRLLRPILLFGLLAAAISFSLYAFVVPRANFAMRSLRGQIVFASHLASDLKPRVFYTDMPGAVLYIEDIQPGTERRLRGVILVCQGCAEQNPSPDAPTQFYRARYGDLYPATDGDGKPVLVLNLYDGAFHAYQSDDPDHYDYGRFESRTETLPMQDYLRAFLDPPSKVVRDFTPRELLDEIGVARAALQKLQSEIEDDGRGANRTFVAENRLRTATVELHQRLALPLASFFFAALALPLGVTRVRSGKGAGFALSLIVILIYWAAFTLARNQASAGNIPVWLGTWSGNLLMIPWAVVALWRLHRGKRAERSLMATVYYFVRRLIRGAFKAVRNWRSRRPRRESDENGRQEDSPTRLISRLDIYVAVSFMRVLLFAMLAAYTIYALVDFKSVLDDVLRNQRPLSLVGDYFKFFAPGVLYVVLPVACLIGAVVTFALLTRTGELTAIKASGISMRRVTAPVLLITFGLCLLLFVVQDRIAPVTNRKAQEVRDRISGRPPRSHGAASGRWTFGPERSRLFHTRLLDPDKLVAEQLTVFTLDRGAPRVASHRFADQARWHEGNWELTGGWYLTFPADGSEGVFERYEGTSVVALPPPESFTGKQFGITRLGDMAEQMSVQELRDEIDSLAASGYDLTRLQVDYHTKWAHPLSPFVMALLGLPFAFKVGRRGSLYSIGVALLLVLVYWAAMAMFQALGLENVLDPRIAAWAPNVLFGLIGLYLMLFIKT